MSNPPTIPENSPDSIQPLEWIHLELIPLPDKTQDFQTCNVWWNPDTGEIVGEQAEMINNIIKTQLAQGSVTNSMGTIELANPFQKPSELASILGQFFWVVPVPVAKPYEKNSSNDSIIRDRNTDSLH